VCCKDKIVVKQEPKDKIVVKQEPRRAPVRVRVPHVKTGVDLEEIDPPKRKQSSTGSGDPKKVKSSLTEQKDDAGRSDEQEAKHSLPRITRSDWFMKLPSDAMSHLESIDGRECFFFVNDPASNEKRIPCGTGFVERVDSGSDRRAPLHAMDTPGYARVSGLSLFDGGRQYGNRKDLAQIKTGYNTKLDDGIVDENNVKVATFAKAVELKRPVYVWWEYLKLDE